MRTVTYAVCSLEVTQLNDKSKVKALGFHLQFVYCSYNTTCEWDVKRFKLLGKVLQFTLHSQAHGLALGAVRVDVKYTHITVLILP